MTVKYSPESPYKGDDLGLEVTSYGTAIGGYSVYLDGYLYGGCDVDCHILTMTSGRHTIVVAKDNYQNLTFSVEVKPTTYANSPDVRTELTNGQRASVINSGKADLRVYDSPGCSICAQVIPVINKIVDNNRQCIAYEHLHAYDHMSEPDVKSFGVTTFPFIVVEGSRGKFKANGFVTSTLIKNLITEASGCGLT
jgi:hypothetical protein